LIFLLYSIAMLLHSHRRYVLAAAALALALLVHPALILGAGLYMASLAFLYYEQRSNPAGKRFQWIRRSEAVIGGLALAAIAAEAILVSRHIDLFRQHMAFQVHRKAMRGLFTVLTHRRGNLLLIETLLAAFGLYGLRRRGQALQDFLRHSGPIVLVALGLQTYATFGYEGPYAIYSYAVVPATLLCVAYGAISMLSEGDRLDEDAALSGASRSSESLLYS
jgi:hypothetical protein